MIKAPILQGSRERSFTSFCIDSGGSTIYAANANNRIYSFNLVNFSSIPVQVYDAPDYESNSFFIKLALSPDDQYLASGSYQDSTFIWSTNRRGGCFKLPGHFGEVTAVSWTEDSRGRPSLLSAGEDGYVNLWKEAVDEDDLRIGQPMYIPKKERIHSKEEESLIEEDTYAECMDELESWPDHARMFVEKENIGNVRPSTPPNLIISSSILNTTCKKSIISDYFRPLNPGTSTSFTDILIQSYKSSPNIPTKTAIETSGLKRLSNCFNFPSPLRPKQPKADQD